MDRTFVMIKPDGVQRGIIGAVISRLEAKGLKLVAARLTMLSEEKVMEHYAEHVKKPFFPSLKEYVMSGPVLTMVWEGKGAVAIVRKLVGATNPAEAAPGTIRGDFGMETGKNVIHASDSDESAAREIAIHFSDDELISYARIDEPVLYE
ncbi:nucleoside-diphosphate kinase [uncultured Methanofollis sp.]|uniref:nucleoside-diphosphate kinase n=1 Tax=uncultured Methanofollis sp. TaxID=262500 RepID=UPI00263886C6|nr:nucleoside-diphosphate kinase [uncultured Methanofollis sp.]